MIDFGLETGITRPEHVDAHRQLYQEDHSYRKTYQQLICLMKLMFFGTPLSISFLVWILWWGKTSLSPWVTAFGIGANVALWLFWFIWQPLKRRCREIASLPETHLVPTPKVPHHALEFCLRIFLSSENCDNILNDLDERFDLDSERFGSRRAQVLRACDLVRSLWPFVVSAVRNFLKFVGWGSLAGVVDWVRRHV